MAKKIVLIILALVSISVCVDITPYWCGYGYKATATFRVDRVYSPPNLPLQFGEPAYDSFISQNFFTPLEIEDLRITSLEWFKERFGLPIETAVYNATSKVTTIPGIGTVTPVFFNPDYDLISGSPLFLSWGCPRLVVTEFSFLSNSGNISFNYSGAYGDLYAQSGQTAPMLVGDSLSYGYYWVSKIKLFHREYVRRLIFKSKYPIRPAIASTLPDAILWQESYIEDEDLGEGISKLSIRLDTLTDGRLLADVTTTWIFTPKVDPDNYFPTTK